MAQEIHGGVSERVSRRLEEKGGHRGIRGLVALYFLGKKTGVSSGGTTSKSYKTLKSPSSDVAQNHLILCHPSLPVITDFTSTARRRSQSPPPLTRTSPR